MNWLRRPFPAPLPCRLMLGFDTQISDIVVKEGAGRESKLDQKRFFQIAMGSLRESQAILDLANITLLIELADKLAAHLYKLIQSKMG